MYCFCPKLLLRIIVMEDEMVETFDLFGNYFFIGTSGMRQVKISFIWSTQWTE